MLYINMMLIKSDAQFIATAAKDKSEQSANTAPQPAPNAHVAIYAAMFSAS